jgi:hypothetical protein
MGVLAIANPLPIVALGGTLEQVARLASPAPKEAASTAGGNRTIDIDLGAVAAIDTVFLGYVEGGAGASFAITGGAADYTTTAIGTLQPAPSRLAQPRQHFLLVLDEPVEVRFIRIAGLALPAMNIGVLAVGRAIRPKWGHEYGGGRFVVDSGVVTRLSGGGFGTSRAARAGGWQWTLGDLDDAETDALYGLQLDAGETATVLVVEDPDPTAGLNERIHWGLLSRLEPYERQDTTKTKWALRIEDWS